MQHFEKSENLRPNTDLCLIKTKTWFANLGRKKVFATAHRDRAPYAPQPNTVNHSFLNLPNLHTMIYNAFEALKAFYRTTVVPLHFGKHRTFNLHTLPALLIPFLI